MIRFLIGVVVLFAMMLCFGACRTHYVEQVPAAPVIVSSAIFRCGLD